jgi:hypothetical protein
MTYLSTRFFNRYSMGVNQQSTLGNTMPVIKAKVVPGNIRIDESMYNEWIKAGHQDGVWARYRCLVPGHEDHNPSLSMMVEHRKDTDQYRLAISHKSANHPCTNAEIYQSFGVPYYSESQSYWDYLNADGTYHHTKFKYERFDEADQRISKHYTSAIRNGDQSYEFKGVFTHVNHILYNLPNIHDALDQIVVVEGERKVEALADWGLVATCSDNGARSWTLSYGELLSPIRRIVILPDNDPSGVGYLKKVAYSVIKAGNPEVYTLELPGLQPKGDIVDWIKDGHTREELDQLMNSSLVQITLEEVKDVAESFGNITPVRDESGDNVEMSPDVRALLEGLRANYVYLTEHGMDHLTQIVQNDIGGSSFSKTTPPTLKNGFYAGYYVYRSTLNKKGEEVLEPINVVDYWNEPAVYGHDRGPRVYSRVEFDPRPNPDPSIYNLWSGLPIEPVFDADIEEFLEFLRGKLCGNDDKAYAFFLSFFAHLLQQPHVVPMVALVLRGPKRSGKSGVIDLFVRLLGRYSFVAQHWDNVTGKFNNQLAGKLLVSLDDACWGGYKEGVGFLNNLITGRTLSIEAKRMNAITIANFARVVVVGNDQWLVPKTRDDGRFFVIDVPPRVADFDYQDFFETWQQRENLAKIAGYLLRYDLSNWTPIDDVLARTVGHDMSLNELSPLEKFLLQCGSAGALTYPPAFNPQGVGYSEADLQAGTRLNWPKRVALRGLRQAYKHWCDDHRHTDDCDDTRFSKKLYSILGIDGADKSQVNRSNSVTWWFPMRLFEFRALLARRYKLGDDYWDNDETAETPGEAR